MHTTKPSRRPAGVPKDLHLGTPHGVISPRVQAAGPEHFGVVAVDCAKARSKWMLTDFYGRVLIEPTGVEHRGDAFAQAITRLRQALVAHGVRDLVVAVERTGRYHHLARDAFAAAGFDTRVVHPSISRHFRQASDFDNKTDDTDLKGITRARSTASPSRNPHPTPSSRPCDSGSATAATSSKSRPRSAARSANTSGPASPATNAALIMSS